MTLSSLAAHLVVVAILMMSVLVGICYAVNLFRLACICCHAFGLPGGFPNQSSSLQSCEFRGENDSPPCWISNKEERLSHCKSLLLSHFCDSTKRKTCSAATVINSVRHLLHEVLMQRFCCHPPVLGSAPCVAHIAQGPFSQNGEGHAYGTP